MCYITSSTAYKNIVRNARKDIAVVSLGFKNKKSDSMSLFATYSTVNLGQLVKTQSGSLPQIGQEQWLVI